MAMLPLAYLGMTYQTFLWEVAIVSLTWLLLIWAALQAITERERKRIQWLAFFVVGSAYMLLSLNASYGPTLVTNLPIAVAAEHLDIGGALARDSKKTRILYAYGAGGTLVVEKLNEFFLLLTAFILGYFQSSPLGSLGACTIGYQNGRASIQEINDPRPSLIADRNSFHDESLTANFNDVASDEFPSPTCFNFAIDLHFAALNHQLRLATRFRLVDQFQKMVET